MQTKFLISKAATFEVNVTEINFTKITEFPVLVLAMD